MNAIKWNTDKTIAVGPYAIPLGPDVEDGHNQGSGCRRNSPFKRALKQLFYPIMKRREDWFVDGFIEKEVGTLIRQYIRPDSVVLEIGCGDVSLRRFIPETVAYNGIDLELTDFYVLSAMRHANVNLACASATNLPVPDNSVTLMISTEALEHIPAIDQAMSEMHRVCAPGAILIGSIPNNLCYKYDRKGKNIQHVNEWSLDGFVQFMGEHGFEVISTKMLGKWIELPAWISSKTFQTSASSKDEYYNTNFIFTFRAAK